MIKTINKNEMDGRHTEIHTHTRTIVDGQMKDLPENDYKSCRPLGK